MNIGIIFAMDIEKNAFFNRFEKIELIKQNDLSVYRLHHGKHNIYAIRSGIGKVHAAFKTTLFINRYNIDLCINSGIAGGVDVEVGQLVLARRTMFHDVDVTAFGYTYGQIPDMPAFFDLESAYLRHFEAHLKDVPYKIGAIATGDQFLKDIGKLDEARQLYDDIHAVDMETAAIAQVAHLFDVPYLAFRVISDKLSSENQLTNYEKGVEEGVEKAADALMRFLDSL